MYRETASRNMRKLKEYMAVNASVVVSGCLNWKVLMKTRTIIMYIIVVSNCKLVLEGQMWKMTLNIPWRTLQIPSV